MRVDLGGPGMLTSKDLDGVDGTAAELNLGADRVAASAFEFNRAVDGEIGASAAGELSVDGDVDEHGAVLHGGIDARDAAFNDAVAGVDLRELAVGDVLGLGLGDADLG